MFSDLSTSTEALYPEMYRQRAVKTVSRLSNPVLSQADKLELPRASIFFHVPIEELSIGPNPRDLPLNTYENDILVEHVEHLTNKEGARPTNVNFRNLERDYHRRYRALGLVRRIETALRSDNNLLMVNLGTLNHAYKYQRSLLARWYQFNNIQETFVSELNKYSKLAPNRNLFFRMDVPEVMPKREDLERGRARLTTTWLDGFKDIESLMFADLYYFVHQRVEFREYSTLSKLTAETLTKTNILFVVDSKWVMLNLGDLSNWRNETSIQDDLYKFLDKMFEQKTPVELEDDEDDEDELIESNAKDSVGNVLNHPTRLEKEIVRQVTELGENGALSVGEQGRMIKLSAKYRTIKLENGQTLEEFARIDDKIINEVPERVIPDIPTVFDKSMLRTTVGQLDDKYAKELLAKDIANIALMPQHAGFALTDFKQERVIDALNDYTVYKFSYTPVRGAPSTVSFRLPTIRPDGNFMSNGILRRMSPQRGDLPIRKVNPSKVSLTSYYGKLFIIRGNKMANNYGTWLQNKIVSLCIGDEAMIQQPRFSNVFSINDKTTRTYAAMAERFTSFDVNGYKLFWNYTKINEHFGEKEIKLIPDGFVPCGHNKEKEIVLIDQSDTFYVYKGGKTVEPIGSIEEILGFSLGKKPVDTAEIGIFGKSIPIGILLAWNKGLIKVIKKLGVKYRAVNVGQRYQLDSDEYELRFQDRTFIFSRTDRKAGLILAGFNNYKDFIKEYNFAEFNKRDVYFNLLEYAGLGLRYLNEIGLMFKMFIEHITYDLLVKMGEPTTFEGLLYRTAELLVSSDSPKEIDPALMRIKSHERMAGLMYKSLVDGIRVQNSRPIASKAKLEINPMELYMNICQDASVNLVEKTNPVHNLREKEILTYSGEGGRCGRSMVSHTRQFHENEMGLTSESTADSGKVAINSYTSANPKYSNLRGMTNRYDASKDSMTNVWSTSCLLAPGSDRDDPKRINFISVQNDSTISCDGYHAMPYRTGYEAVLAHRVDNEFAYVARADGKVVSVDATHIRLSYTGQAEDDIVELGTFYGTVSGINLPQRVITDMKVGQRFKAGHVVAFNSGYFQRNVFDQTQVDWKAGVLVNTVMWESNDTFEDSSAISARIAKMLSSDVTQTRTITVNFSQVIHNLVKVGDELDSDTVLCTLEDAFMNNSGAFDEKSLSTLSILSSAAPKADHPGTLEKIEVFYRGEKEDMNESLRKLVTAADNQRAARAKQLGNNEAKTGKLTEMARIQGHVLEQNMVIIVCYITKKASFGGGDKAVFANMLKTVPARIISAPITTVDGDVIDGIFGYRSMNDRIVLSALIMGLSNLTLVRGAERVIDIYEKG